MDLGANKSPDMEITKQSLLQIPELVFHQLLDEKEQKMYLLGREKQALNKKAERLRRELAEVREKKMGLIADLSSSAKMERNASLKIQELEEALKNETKTRVEIETRLARRDEEMSQLQNALVQTEKNLEKSQHQWEEDRTHLLAQNKEDTTSIMQKLTQLQEDQENSQRRWDEEKTNLLAERT
ncbi:myosin-4-like protein [Lates japonicus]|uniref:Myosin-4-like protein n=1 Tax=Lates japonicus TaxID=270547 RepID=A0AAD3MIS8_LATJO|nr:myosin-4-like protein [Lates japonicus]